MPPQSLRTCARVPVPVLLLRLLLRLLLLLLRRRRLLLLLLLPVSVPISILPAAPITVHFPPVAATTLIPTLPMAAIPAVSVAGTIA
jgi:hypothetical protein